MNIALQGKKISIELYLQKGKLLTKENKIQEAIAIYQEAIKIYPRHFRPYYEIAELLKQSQAITEASSYYKQVISLNNKWFKPYYELALIALQNHNFELAIDDLQQAIQLNPEHLWSYFNLGNSYYKLDKKELAIDCYQKCTEIKSDCYLAWFNLGEIFRQKNLLEDAIANYRQALNIKPNEVKTFQKLQNCLAKQSPNQYPDYQAYQLALNEEIKDEQYYYQLGKKLSKQGLIETAIDCYLHVVELNPKFPEVYETIYNSILYLDNCDRIIEVYQHTLQQYPNLLIVKRNLSKIFSRQGNIDLAIKYNKQIASKKINKNFTKSFDQQCLSQPDFLIIGSEKCGTSSLYQYIAKHPQVISAIEKEIHFFTYYFDKGIDWYRSHFPLLPKDGDYITGEASTSYIACHSNAPQKVINLFPEIKLLAVIRDPIERSFSHYQQLVRLGKEYRSFEKVVEIELNILNNIDNDIWSIRQKYWSQAKGILWHSLYFHFLQQWLNIFPSKQLLILRSEDLFTNTNSTMNRVFSFLELNDFSQKTYQTYNSGGKYSQLDIATFQQLQEFFAPYNKKLEELISD